MIDMHEMQLGERTQTRLLATLPRAFVTAHWQRWAWCLSLAMMCLGFLAGPWSTAANEDISFGDVAWSNTFDGCMANHPILKDSKLYVGAARSRQREGYLYVLDAATGKTLNTVKLATMAHLTAPHIVGDAIYINQFTENWADGALQKVDLKTMKVVWTNTLPTTGAEVYATDGQFAYLPLASRKTGRGTIGKIQLSDGQVVADYPVSMADPSHSSGVILIDRMLYYRSQDGYLKAIRCSDMQLAWDVRLDREASYCYNTPIYVPELDYLILGDCTNNRMAGSIYAINAKPDAEKRHKIFWKHAFDDGSFPSIFSCAHGKVFVGRYCSSRNPKQGGNYMAFDAATGRVLWEADSIDSAWHVATALDKHLVNYTYFYHPLAPGATIKKRAGTVLTLRDSATGRLVAKRTFTDFHGVCGIGIPFDGLLLQVGSPGVKAFRIGRSGTKNDWPEKNCDRFQSGYSSGAIQDILAPRTLPNYTAPGRK